MKAMNATRERNVPPGVMYMLTVQMERTTNRFTVHKLDSLCIHNFRPIASERIEIDNDDAVEKAIKKKNYARENVCKRFRAVAILACSVFASANAANYNEMKILNEND